MLKLFLRFCFIAVVLMLISSLIFLNLAAGEISKLVSQGGLIKDNSNRLVTETILQPEQSYRQRLHDMAEGVGSSIYQLLHDSYQTAAAGVKLLQEKAGQFLVQRRNTPYGDE